MLTDYGNVLSFDHRRALMAIHAAMARMANGQLQGRYAVGLPTGTGKTTAIIAFAVALVEAGLDDVSLAVAASKVEELCTLKRALLVAGVPAERIGLIHSKPFAPERAKLVRDGDAKGDGFASEPSEGHDRQILLVTHQRVRGCELGSFNTYRGRARDVVVWDEALLSSEATGIARNDLAGALGWLQAQRGRDVDELVGWLSECVCLIDERVDALALGEEGVLRLPERTEEQLAGYRLSLSRRSTEDPIRSLLDIANESVRVVATDSGGIVWYRISVPPELSNVLILDASHPIRMLTALDPTIRDAEDPKRGLPDVRHVSRPFSRIKTYENVEVYQLYAGGGRSTVEEDLSRPRSEDRKLSLEVADIVSRIPPNEAVLIFTFKPRDGRRNAAQRLRTDLELAGVDTTAEVPVPMRRSGGTTDYPRRPRINFATWGMETALNSYAHCTHVILAGVLQRSPVDLAAAIVGQSNDLSRPLPDSDVRAALSSEVAHVVYQALSRGACRVVNNGKANRMVGYIVHRDAGLKRDLKRVMPGVRWRTWESRHYRPNSGRIAKLADRIRTYLEQLPIVERKVSSRGLKAALEAAEVAGETWRLARDQALEMLPNWELEKASLIRVEAVAS